MTNINKQLIIDSSNTVDVRRKKRSMPEPIPAPQLNIPPAPGNDPKPPAPADQQAPNPPSGDMIPKHRFDEINTKLKEMETWKATQEAEKQTKIDEDLKEKGEWETLANNHKSEAEKAKSELQTERVNNKVAMEAAKLGIKDLDAATKLIDRSKILVDKDGNITGLIEAVQQLASDKPYLRDGVPQPNIGSGSNPPAGGDNRTPRFKHSQLQDAQFYTDHKKEIDEALKLGLVEDDLAH